MTEKPVCNRCGRCCHVLINGKLHKCRNLIKLKCNKTLCRNYNNRFGTYIIEGCYCGPRESSLYDYPECPFNTNKEIAPDGGKKMKNWIWFKKIQLECWWLSVRQNHQKKKFCAKGWHRFNSGSMTVSNAKGKRLHSDYIHCTVCNTYFFPNKKDKDNYLKMKDREQSLFKNILDNAKSNIKVQTHKNKVKVFK